MKLGKKKKHSGNNANKSQNNNSQQNKNNLANATKDTEQEAAQQLEKEEVISNDTVATEEKATEVTSEEKIEEAKEEVKEEPKEEPKEEVKEEPKKEQKQTSTSQSDARAKAVATGTTAEMLAAEDKLDRDLAIAKKKRQQTEAYNNKIRAEERKKEELAIQRAKEAEEKARQNLANAKLAEERKLEQKAKERLEKEEAEKNSNTKGKKNTGAVKKVKVKKSYIDKGMNAMAAMKALLVFVILVIIAYGAAFIYTKTKNNTYYTQLEAKLLGQTKTVSDSSREYTLPESYSMTAEEKESMGLSIGLMDSDCDGLSDVYEIGVTKTNPLVEDSDGDGLSDGAEVMNGLDPLSISTDGVTLDSELIDTVSLSSTSASVYIADAPMTAVVTLTDSDNNSVQGTTGIIGTAAELYMDYSGAATLSFTYTDSDLETYGIDASSLCIYRFNSTSLSFDEIKTTVSNGVATASVSSNGIYLLANSNAISAESKTNVFFLIDNSGSMYPEEICTNSEENDVEFKRLEFSNDLIDKLEGNATFGAAQFLGDYTLIYHLSDDAEAVKEAIDDIRNHVPTFNGTNIANALYNAVLEFNDTDEYDKNYIILLTDGMPTLETTTEYETAMAMAKAKNITVFTIGLGKYIDADYLLTIAEETNGQFFQATNADALENVYEKIRTFMSYNRVNIASDDDSEEETIAYLVADSGFNVEKDGLSYNNFRTDFALNGADFGIAGLNMAYYSGQLGLSASSYTLSDGTVVAGYDISDIEGLSDGKLYLSELTLSVLDTYNSYLSMSSKWSYSKISNGVLPLSEKARSYIKTLGLGVTTTAFTGTFPSSDDTLDFLRKITFQTVKEFDYYENVYIDSEACTGEDAAVMDLIRYFCLLPDSSGHTVVCDFGYDGEDSFELLIEQLSSGVPVVISVNGSAMNAVRLVRDVDNPSKYILEAYDSNSPGRVTKITLVKSAVYTQGGTPTYQYAAYLGNQQVPLQMYIYWDLDTIVAQTTSSN